MDGPDGLESSEASLLTPVQEPGDCTVVCLARVGVTDGDGEEVDEAPGGAIVGGSRSAKAASGPVGVPWTSCWVMGCPVFGKFPKRLSLLRL